MTQPPQLTIRSEEERQAVTALRNALLWRIRVQLQAMPNMTQQQFHHMVSIAVWDTQALATEIGNLFPAIDALQRAGWRAADAFDRSLAPPPAAHPGQVPGGAQPPRQQGSELDQFGRELDKGFREVGSALDGLFSGKKK